MSHRRGISFSLLCACAAVAPIGAQSQPIGTLTSPLDEIAAAVRPGDLAVVIVTSGAPTPRLFTAPGGVWRSSDLPVTGVLRAAAGDRAATGRIAAAFDGRGRLHVAAELRRERRADLYYMSSPDLGATWSNAVFLDSTGSGAFPRIGVSGDVIHVTWGYRAPYRLNVARSDDGGLRWTLPSSVPTDCINVSEAATLRDTAYVACAGYAGDSVLRAGRNPFTGVRIYRIDRSGTPALHATLENVKGVWPRLVRTGGELTLATNAFRVHQGAGKGWDKCCALISRSRNARTWSEPLDAREPLRGDDGWDTFQIREAYSDERGLLHVIADGSDQAEPANGAPGTGARLIHAAFDAAGRAVSEAPITDAVDAPQGYYPGNATLLFLHGTPVVFWSRGTALMRTAPSPAPRP